MVYFHYEAEKVSKCQPFNGAIDATNHHWFDDFGVFQHDDN
jgi:hypothetical protein